MQDGAARESSSFTLCLPKCTETKVKPGVCMGSINPLMYAGGYVGDGQNDFVHAELWRMLLA